MDFGSKYVWSPMARAPEEEDGGREGGGAGDNHLAGSEEDVFDEGELQYSDCEDAYNARDSASSSSGEEVEEAAGEDFLSFQQQQQQTTPTLANDEPEPEEPEGAQQRNRGFMNRVSSLFGGGGGGGAPAAPKAAQRQRNVRFGVNASMPSARRVKKKNRERHVRRADTNVLSLDLGTLSKDADLATGDATECERCAAVLSSVSILKEPSSDDSEGDDGATHLWKCEFCGLLNRLELDEMEVPKAAQLDYLVDTTGEDDAGAAGGLLGGKDSGGAADERAKMKSSGGVAPMGEEAVVFCVDVSGSMCVTTEVSGTQVLKGHERLREQAATLSGFIEGEDQFMRGQRRDTTWVSRLQCVQAAVDEQLGAMATQHPNRRVGLVAFNNDVTAHGDGVSTTTPAVLAGDLLGDFDKIVAKGRELGATMLEKSVKETREKLSDAVFKLQENGATALGPALLASVAMIAGSGRAAGSRVVICTDGRANVGLGDLEEGDEDDAEEFYSAVGDLAAHMGIVVSVVSIKGTDCKMEHLGSVADASGGVVNIVDPLKLTQEFSSILADEVVATGVTVTVKLARGLFIRDSDEGDVQKVRQQQQQQEDPTEASSKAEKAEGEASEDPTSNLNKFVQKIGNVTKETVVSYEYGVERGVDLLEHVGKSDDVPNGLPFQIRIEYTAVRDHSRRMRVITRLQEVTHDRETAEREANVAVLGTAVAQQTAKMAMAGDYSMARANAFSNKLLMQRCAVQQGQDAQETYGAIKEQLVDLDLEMRSATRSERRARGGRSYSDSDGSDDDDEMSSAADKMRKAQSKKKASRKGARNDQLATRMYQMKSKTPKW